MGSTEGRLTSAPIRRPTVSIDATGVTTGEGAGDYHAGLSRGVLSMSPTMTRRLAGAALLLAALSSATAVAQSVPSDLALQALTVPGVSQPIAVRAPNDGSGRMFIVSRTGSVFIYRNGALVTTPFITVPVSTSSEQGLLGLAFHPQFATNGRFYLQLTRPPGGVNIGSSADQLTVEYTVSAGDPDVADTTTRRELVTVGDIAGNHNGGDLHFGQDGFLYISIGDGGTQNDPNGFAQCLWRKPVDNNPANCSPGTAPNYALLGKIMRIDVDGTTPNAPAEMCGTATGLTANYRIPAGNPHVGTSNTCDEIWHYGMRNPFRFSFDRQTGDMVVGDVGQNTWEEVTISPAANGGQNLGWRVCEGRQLFGGGVESCNFGLLPILNYQHTGGRCSITGGYRYRGPINAFRGMIVYADYCSSEIFFGQPDAGSPSGFSAVVWARPTLPTLTSPIGFGEDADGNLYVAAQGGGVFRFVSPTGVDTLFANGFE
jgi:glucose/arabinose dehydrogenase